MSASNTSNTSLTWVSTVNNTRSQSVSLATLPLRLLQNPFLESRSRIIFAWNQLSCSNGFAVASFFFLTVPSKKEHTRTFFLSRKYFVYVCSFIGQGSLLLNMWSSLVLCGSIRFMPIGTVAFKCPSNSAFSRPNFPKSTHFFLYMLKLVILSWLTTVCDVRIFIQLHRKKIKMGCCSYH